MPPSAWATWRLSPSDWAPSMSRPWSSSSPIRPSAPSPSPGFSAPTDRRGFEHPTRWRPSRRVTSSDHASIAAKLADPAPIDILDAGRIPAAGHPIAEPGCLHLVQARPFIAVEAVPQSEEKARHALIERTELGILTDDHFIGRTRVAAVEALRLGRKRQQDRCEGQKTTSEHGNSLAKANTRLCEETNDGPAAKVRIRPKVRFGLPSWRS